MSHSLLVGVVAGAVAGAAGAGLVGVALLPAAPAPQEGELLSPQSSLRGLQDRLAALERENGELVARVRTLEQRPLSAVAEREPAPVAPDPEQVALEDELRDLVASLKNPSTALPPTLRASVKEELLSIEEEREREREAQRDELMAQRLEERISELAVELGLDVRQTGEMKRILNDENARRNEAMRTIRESGDWTSARDSMRTIRDETQAALKLVLSPEQYEKYQEQEPGGVRFGSFQGGDRPGGGFDGGGGGGRRARGRD